MHNRLSRFIAPPSVLLVCAMTGCCSTRSLETTVSGGRHYPTSIKDANVNKKEVTLDKTLPRCRLWVSDERDQKLFIEFKDNAPFEQMVQVESGRWRVQCADWTCSSARHQGRRDRPLQVLADSEGQGRKREDTSTAR